MTTTHLTAGAHPPLEDVAALVDGRLGESRRMAVLAHVDSCPACHEVLVETTRMVESGDLSEDLPDPGAHEVQRAPPRQPVGKIVRFPTWRAAAVAATLAAAAAVAFFLVRPPLATSPDHLPVATLAGGLSSAAATVVGDIAPEAWPAVRGEHVSMSGSERTAFQIGALVLRLEVALRGGRPAVATSLARDIVLRLAEFEVHEAFDPYFVGASSIAELAAADRLQDALDLLHEADALLGGDPSEAAPAYLDPFWYSFGKWAAAGELAAAAGDPAYFRSSAHRGYARALDAAELPEPVASDLGAVRDQLARAAAAQDDRPSAVLHEAFENLVASGGGGRSSP